jgi:cell division protein FtsB
VTKLDVLREYEALLTRRVNRRYEGAKRLKERRDELRAEIAALSGTPQLPKPRNRSNVQQQVARCPRCMGEIAA